MENREGLQVTQPQDESAHVTESLGRDGGKRACSIIGVKNFRLPQPARLPQSVSALHHCKLDVQHTDSLKLLVAVSPTSPQTPQQDGILHTIPPYFYEPGSPTSSQTLQTDGMLHTECCRLIADARQVQRKMAANVPRRSDAESLSCLHGCRNPYPRSIHTCKQAKIAKH